MPGRLEDPWYDADADRQIRRLRLAGEIKWRGEFAFSEALPGETRRLGGSR